MTDRFAPSVLAPDPDRRGPILDWLEAALAAVDPERLTAEALRPLAGARCLVISIGKAAAAMARGAASVLDIAGGVCVSNHIEPAPHQLAFVVGDHPVPGPASFEAASLVLEAVRSTPISTPIIALVSGGGSALCEMPRPGVSPEFMAEVNKRLLAAGTGIEELNLVRAHLSVIKGGGVSRAAGRSIGTYVISDVAGADPGVVASGPTIPHRVDPAAAEAILRRASIDVPREVQVAMTRSELPLPEPEVTVLADGFDAARGAASVAPDPVDIRPDWLDGDLAGCLTRFLEEAGEGVTIAVGEPVLEVDGPGRGGRNTHAALLAAELIESSEDIFTAFATDGVDGSSKSAGAIVDGQTTSRGGSPAPARAGFDSSGYLGKTSDLLKCAPTGTNVADIWILWRRGVDRNVE